MIIPDVNLLIYAVDSSSQFHDRARTWWEELLNAEGSVGLPWSVSLGFVRIATSARAFSNPLTFAQASSYVEEWLGISGVEPIDPGPGHWRRVRDLLLPIGVGGKLVSDAHLAAMAIEHHATLATHDRDFQRFAGLRCVNPLK